jgi:hypothetical protein
MFVGENLAKSALLFIVYGIQIHANRHWKNPKNRVRLSSIKN